MAPDKMQGHFYASLTQLFMLFHMVASVWLFMVAFSTILLLVKILQQPIRIFEISSYWSCHGEENASYHLKEDENLYQKMVSKVTLHFVWSHLSRKQTVLSRTIPSLVVCTFKYLDVKWWSFSEFLPLFISNCKHFQHITSTVFLVIGPWVTSLHICHA